MAEHELQCMEVWGGNSAADAGVKMAGVDARVLSQPLPAHGSGADESGSGGDVYYMSSCASGRITRLLVADVSGHGAPVAETGARLRKSMRRFVNHVDQRGFLRSLNRDFFGFGEGFATAAAVSYFGPTREITVSLAGHPAPLLRRAKTGAWSLLRSAGGGARTAALPLGVDDATAFEQFRVSLEVGDLVLMYTDALIESRDADGQMLGEDGLLEVAAEIDSGEPGAVVVAMQERLLALAPGNLADDDVTLLAFRPNGVGDGWRLWASLRAPFRMMGAIGRRMAGGDDPIPWPEMSMRTMGGPISKWMARRNERAQAT